MKPLSQAQRENLRLIDEHVREAHRHLLDAIDLAYGANGGLLAPRRVRLALDRAQQILIKLIVHVLIPALREGER